MSHEALKIGSPRPAVPQVTAAPRLRAYPCLIFHLDVGTGHKAEHEADWCGGTRLANLPTSFNA